MNEPQYISIVLKDYLEDIKAHVRLLSKEVLDIEDVSLLTGYNKQTIYRMSSEKLIPHYKQGRMLRFRKNEIEIWMTLVKINTQAETSAQAQYYLNNHTL